MSGVADVDRYKICIQDCVSFFSGLPTPGNCSRQKRKMFAALSAEFIVEDEPSSVQFYLQRLLTRHNVMITAGAGSRHLLDVHLPAGCYNQLDALPLEVGLHVFRLDAFPPDGPDDHGEDVLPDGTIHPDQGSIHLLNNWSDHRSLEL